MKTVIPTKIDVNNLKQMKAYLLAFLQTRWHDELYREGRDPNLLHKGGKALPVGTIRKWGDKTYKKIPGGSKEKARWVRMYQGESRGKNISIGIIKRKIQQAQSYEALVKIVRDNRSRFLKEDGQIDPIIGKFLQLAKEKKPSVVEKKTTVQNKKDQVQDETQSELQEKEKLIKEIQKTLENPKLGGNSKRALQSTLKDLKKEIAELKKEESLPAEDKKESIDKIAEKKAAEVPNQEPVTTPEEIQKVINQAVPENRSLIQAKLMGKSGEGSNQLDEVQKGPYEYQPGFTEAGHGLGSLLDYTKVVPKNIALANPKTILDNPRPSWIPELDSDFFKYTNNRIVAVKLSDDKYFLKTSRKVVGTGGSEGVLVSLDVLSATQHYYLNKVKAENKKYIEEYRNEKIKKYESQIQELKQKENSGQTLSEADKFNLWRAEENLKNPQKIKPMGIKPVRTLADNKMTYVQSNLFAQMGIVKLKDKWEANTELVRDLKQKMSDMQIQYEDMLNTYAKGQETSYGDKGLKNDLLKSHGVKVKRQNGDEITPSEINDISQALNAIYKVFGNRKEMCEKFGLKISHSGKVLMHARTASGIYFPAFRAIGVSKKRGSQAFGFTLAHEFGHFMDNYLGDGKGLYFDSDKAGSLSNQIADTFRSSMEVPQKSNYQNRTCECFARAMAQYVAFKSGYLEDYQSSKNTAGNHPSAKDFESKISPLIDQWLKENSSFLKSCTYKLVLK